MKFIVFHWEAVGALGRSRWAPSLRCGLSSPSRVTKVSVEQRLALEHQCMQCCREGEGLRLCCPTLFFRRAETEAWREVTGPGAGQDEADTYLECRAPGSWLPDLCLCQGTWGVDAGGGGEQGGLG